MRLKREENLSILIFLKNDAQDPAAKIDSFVL